MPQKSINIEQIKEYNTKNVDSTGINLWPSEEILAYYCYENFELFKNKNICEIGAGYSGLSLLLLANLQKRCNKVVNYFVNDGNEDCAQRLKQIYQQNLKDWENINIIYTENEIKDGLTNILVDKLEWAKDFKCKEKYDAIICADCLFFESFHEHLICTLIELLRDSESFCIMIAPKRGKSMDNFIKKCVENKLKINFLSFNDKILSEMKKLESNKDYDQDREYFQIFEIKK